MPKIPWTYRRIFLMFSACWETRLIKSLQVKQSEMQSVHFSLYF